ncbi:MAG: ATP-binding cassette domain-containing protein [Erysipelotrichales bacterium]
MLEVKDLNFYYDGNPILEEINIKFKETHIYGILGSNGAGKSTLLKCLGNQLYPNSGHIYYKDEYIYDNLNYISDTFLLDNDYFVGTYSPLSLLQTFSKERGLDIDYEAFHKFLEQYNIEKTTHLSKLSKGNQRIAYLIVVLSLNPRVLILDEFLDGIDIVKRVSIKNSLLNYVKKNSALLIIASHTTSDINDISDYLILIDNKQIKKECTLDELKATYISYQLVLKDNINSDDLELMGIDVYNYRAFENIRWFTIENDINQKQLVEKLDLIQLKEIPTKLEEVIFNEFNY